MIGINWEGQRNILAVELASRESILSWKELLAGLRHDRYRESNSWLATIMLACGARFRKLCRKRFGNAVTCDQTLLRKNVVEIRPSRVSLMPEGFEEKLNTQDIADVIAYLRGGL